MAVRSCLFNIFAATVSSIRSLSKRHAVGTGTGTGTSLVRSGFLCDSENNVVFVDVEVGLYVNGRTETEGVEGRVLRRVFGLRGWK